MRDARFAWLTEPRHTHNCIDQDIRRGTHDSLLSVGQSSAQPKSATCLERWNLMNPRTLANLRTSGAGLPLAAGGGRLISSILFGVSPWDALTLTFAF
jgi:hypothetical protein